MVATLSPVLLRKLLFIRDSLSRFYVLLWVSLNSVWKLLLVSQMEDSEGTVRQIGAFSEGIQNLTVRIQRFTRTHCTHIYSIDTTVLGAFGCKVVFFLLCAFYQSMLKDDEFFKEISNSPNPSVTDEDSNAWDCWHHQIWSCCEWNSVPTLSTCTQTCLNKPQESS